MILIISSLDFVKSSQMIRLKLTHLTLAKKAPNFITILAYKDSFFSQDF